MINCHYSSHWIGIDQQSKDKREQHTHMLCVTAVTFDHQMIYEHSRVTDTLTYGPSVYFSSLCGRLSITTCRSLFSHISVYIRAQLWGEVSLLMKASVSEGDFNSDSADSMRMESAAGAHYLRQESRYTTRSFLHCNQGRYSRSAERRHTLHDRHKHIIKTSTGWINNQTLMDTSALFISIN